MSAVRTPCEWCGQPTLAIEGVCTECRRNQAAQSEIHFDDDGLKDGRWVLGPRRVLVWEPSCDYRDAS